MHTFHFLSLTVVSPLEWVIRLVPSVAFTTGQMKIFIAYIGQYSRLKSHFRNMFGHYVFGKAKLQLNPPYTPR